MECWTARRSLRYPLADVGCFVRATNWGAFAAIIAIAAVVLSFATRAIAHDLGLSAEFRNKSQEPADESDDAQGTSGIAGLGSQVEEEEDDDDQLHVLLLSEFIPVPQRVSVAASSSHYRRERCQPPTPPPLA